MPPRLSVPRHRHAASSGRPVWLVTGGVLMAGAVVAVVLLVNRDDDPAPLATPLPPPIQTVANGTPPPAPAGGTTTSSAKATTGTEGQADVVALRQLARQAADSVNQRDVRLAKNTYCQVDAVSQRELDTIPPGFTVVITGDPVVTGDRASIPATGTLNGQRRDTPIPAKKEQGRWCVDGTEDPGAG